MTLSFLYLSQMRAPASFRLLPLPLDDAAAANPRLPLAAEAAAAAFTAPPAREQEAAAAATASAALASGAREAAAAVRARDANILSQNQIGPMVAAKKKTKTKKMFFSSFRCCLFLQREKK